MPLSVSEKEKHQYFRVFYWKPEDSEAESKDFITLRHDICYTSPKWRYTTEKDVQYNSDAPDINFLPISSTQYFWSHIVGTSNNFSVYLSWKKSNK